MSRYFAKYLGTRALPSCHIIINHWSPEKYFWGGDNKELLRHNMVYESCKGEGEMIQGISTELMLRGVT